MHSKLQFQAIIIIGIYYGDALKGMVCARPTFVNYIMYFRLAKMTQELGTVVALDGKLDFSKYPIGSTLKILPNHVSKSEDDFKILALLTCKGCPLIASLIET